MLQHYQNTHERIVQNYSRHRKCNYPLVIYNNGAEYTPCQKRR